MITRYLNQDQLRQLVLELVFRLDEKSSINVYEPNFVSNSFKKDENGITITDENDDDFLVVCKTTDCLVKFLNTFTISFIDYVFSDNTRVSLYDFRYLFNYSPDQRDILDKYLPKLTFDYPVSKLTEKEYYLQLKEENQNRKAVLSDLLGRNVADLVGEYHETPEQIETRRFLEGKLAKGSLIADYL